MSAINASILANLKMDQSMMCRITLKLTSESPEQVTRDEYPELTERGILGCPSCNANTRRRAKSFTEAEKGIAIFMKSRSSSARAPSR